MFGLCYPWETVGRITNHIHRKGIWILKEQLVKAARMHAEGELERAKTNIMVYMNQSATGIGEHSDIVEAIQDRT